MERGIVTMVIFSRILFQLDVELSRFDAARLSPRRRKFSTGSF